VQIFHCIVLYCIKTGIWLRALGNGDQCRLMGRKARERLYVFLIKQNFYSVRALAVCKKYYKTS